MKNEKVFYITNEVAETTAPIEFKSGKEKRREKRANQRKRTKAK